MGESTNYAPWQSDNGITSPSSRHQKAARLMGGVRYQNQTQRDRESQEIARAAQRFAKSGDRSELESYSTEALKKADYQYSNRYEGSGYRKPIKDLIDERLENAQGKKDSMVRSIGYTVALAIGIIAGAVVVKYL